MATGITNRLINFIMSWWIFDDKKNKKNDVNEKWEIFENKSDYINKVAEFLESGVKEMKKDIRRS